VHAPNCSARLGISAHAPHVRSPVADAGRWAYLPVRIVALGLIRMYQRHISPHKGFRCAYHHHLNGPSCSNFGYRALRRYGVVRGLATLRVRLELCGTFGRASRKASFPIRQQGACDVSPLDFFDFDCDGGTPRAGRWSPFDFCDFPCCDWPFERKNRRGNNDTRISKRLSRRRKEPTS
jgi:putative component of membrane protein insertase Oxa1/YidC/SpoIIIJ protein YidD